MYVSTNSRCHTSTCMLTARFALRESNFKFSCGAKHEAYQVVLEPPPPRRPVSRPRPPLFAPPPAGQHKCHYNIPLGGWSDRREQAKNGHVSRASLATKRPHLRIYIHCFFCSTSDDACRGCLGHSSNIQSCPDPLEIMRSTERGEDSLCV